MWVAVLPNSSSDKPATGWVKADSLPSQESTQEIRELRRQVAELKRELKTVRTTAPKEIAPLAQGEDQFEIEYTFKAYGSDSVPYSESYSVSWSQIFLRLAPLMIDGASDSTLEGELSHMTEEENTETLRRDGASKYSCPEYSPSELSDWLDEEHQDDFHPEEFHPQAFWITSTAFEAIKHQLLALKLIKKSGKKKTFFSGNYWTLTSHGLTRMAELRAIRKTDKSL